MANSSITISAEIVPLLKGVRSFTAQSQHVKSAAFSLGEYVLIPLFHIAATPVFVRHLGLDLYGLWMLYCVIAGDGLWIR
jgi:hypothetical protein